MICDPPRVYVATEVDAIKAALDSHQPATRRHGSQAWTQCVCGYDLYDYEIRDHQARAIIAALTAAAGVPGLPKEQQ